MKQLQVSTATINHRHHHEFQLLKAMDVLNHRRVSSGGAPRILSFGCSTGEEPALLKKLFPECDVFGIDVNEGALEIARERFKDVEFYNSDLPTLRSLAPFDLVTCCSVLCIHPSKIEGGKTVGLPFDFFVEVLGELTNAVHPGGFLFLFNLNFPFRFHPNFCNFESIDNARFNGVGFVNLFNPSSRGGLWPMVTLNQEFIRMPGSLGTWEGRSLICLTQTISDMFCLESDHLLMTYQKLYLSPIT